MSYHLSNIVSSWKIGKLMCVSFGFSKGTWSSACSEGLMKKDQKIWMLCQHCYSLTLCKAWLDFLGLLFLILESGSFRKSIVRSVLAVRIPVLFCQSLLHSNTFFYFLLILNSFSFFHIPWQTGRSYHIDLKAPLPTAICQSAVSLLKYYFS